MLYTPPVSFDHVSSRNVQHDENMYQNPDLHPVGDVLPVILLRRVDPAPMRRDFADADSAPTLERTPNATPQVAVLAAAMAHPPASPKAFDQVVPVRAND